MKNTLARIAVIVLIIMAAADFAQVHFVSEYSTEMTRVTQKWEDDGESALCKVNSRRIRTNDRKKGKGGHKGYYKYVRSLKRR